MNLIEKIQKLLARYQVLEVESRYTRGEKLRAEVHAIRDEIERLTRDVSPTKFKPWRGRY